MRKSLALIATIIVAAPALYAQDIVNAYAKVTAIAGTQLTLSNINTANDDFLVGEQIIIMQMQDDVIGANVDNDPSFGDIEDIESAGLYEKATIASVDLGSNEIVLQATLSNAYHIGANSSVQIISYPNYANFSTTANLTALDWDGNVGGVLAIKVTGTLTLNHNIILDGKGFRGGGLNTTNEINGNCDALTYRTNNGQYGRKGESVYLNTNTNYVAARGKIANGGGGGNKHNSGGGGGGNFTAGGLGGPGYNESNNAAGCYDDPSGDAGTGAGAYGGADLSNYISASRLFMGGGGGGGQQDNATTGQSEAGGDGGGIVIIQADEVSVPCGAGVAISANGIGFPYPAVDAGQEGGPGAGAGGSLLFQVNTWTLTCALATEAKGGEGQSSTYTLPHGGGGGGGKGVSVFSGAVPVANFTADNSQGAGGSNGTGNPAASGSADGGGDTPANPAYQGSGSNGVIPNAEGPLPVELVSWKGEAGLNSNSLYWSTSSERNNNYFTLERSSEGINWESIAVINGQGSSSKRNDYSYKDYTSVTGINYYRLSQTDYDGTTEQFHTIAIESSGFLMSNILLYPNPSDGKFVIQLSDDISRANLGIEVFDLTGKQVTVNYVRTNQKIEFDFKDNTSGSYLLKIQHSSGTALFRVVLK